MHFPSQLIECLRDSQKVVVLTGAGVSQESGLKTFRDKLDGIWTEYRPEDLATPEAFEKNPDLVWEFYSMRRLKGRDIEPNAAHSALAEMENHYQVFTLVTQNVDGLHQRAGSTNVLELHGNITRVRCNQGCGVFTEWDESEGGIPACPHCGARLRPDVVWFGEMLPGEILEMALSAARTCQVFFSIGTSAVVQPAATLPLIAKENGAIIVEVNTEKTPLTPYVEYFLAGKAGEILPELSKKIWRTNDYILKKF